MASVTPINIAILGAGSIGCYLGGCLAASNNPDLKITLIGRQRLQQQIADHGLTVTDWRGRNSQVMASQIQFALSPAVLAKADVILLTVKSGDSAAAAAQIVQYANPAATVISFQNGVSNVELLQSLLPNQRILRGMVPFNVFNQGDGHFHCGTEGDLALEAISASDSPAVAGLIRGLAQAQLPLRQYENMLEVQWGKLIINLNNAVNALAGIPLRDQLNHRQYRQVMALVITEALGILKQAGITPARSGKVVPALLPHILRLPNVLFRRVASAMLKVDPQARSSMYEDLQLHRKTEIDYLNGEIVQLAQQHRLSANANGAIVALVKQAEQAEVGSPQLSAPALLQQLQK
ncbi:2-dehydropantoate 2-reductase [uncultured Ferrimonas sp.]|uniref:2-dehydropantoate 2-reductase n=1 Tax=uncultured Ferrimonas sp. TaxID=432640 RepID=UPI00262911A5|nr:2-dehydropantoate 2-reductase [uncultured Ferrimonas sp.]